MQSSVGNAHCAIFSAASLSILKGIKPNCSGTYRTLFSQPMSKVWHDGCDITGKRATSNKAHFVSYIITAIIIIIIIIIIISFMQGIYTNIPETNYVPREHGVAAILLFLFMVRISLVSVLNLLYFYISTFRSMCAVPNMAVFCISLTSWFPGMLLTYFLNVFEIVPVAPIIIIIIIIIEFNTKWNETNFRTWATLLPNAEQHLATKSSNTENQ